MKAKWLIFILVFLLISINAYAADGDLIVNGKIGVGTTSPATPLEVNGVIKSTTGGVQFPDNTTQTSALPGGCTAGQIAKWNGTQWACAADDSGGSGTITVYFNPNIGCRGAPALTTSATCTTIFCGRLLYIYDEVDFYYTCNGSCGNPLTAVTCSNTYAGKLMP